MTAQLIELAINSGYVAYMLGKNYNPKWTYYKQLGFKLAIQEAQNSTIKKTDYSNLWPYDIVRQAIEDKHQ